MDVRDRNWCITHNNYTEEDVKTYTDYFKTILYGVIGKEISKSGTPHLQIFFCLKNARTFKSLKKSFPIPHIEPRYKDSSNEQASQYCKKEGNFIEFGALPCNQGKRTDLNDIRDEILTGLPVDSIIVERPMLYHQYGRTLHAIEDIRMRQLYRNFKTEGIWICGLSGTGKSTLAFKNFTPQTHYVWKYEASNWQDGYTQQETIILDEFRGQIKFSDLLMMIDEHPNFYVSRRGRPPLPFLSKKVIITSVLRPEEVYKNLSLNDKMEQLTRRIIIQEL